MDILEGIPANLPIGITTTGRLPEGARGMKTFEEFKAEHKHFTADEMHGAHVAWLDREAQLSASLEMGPRDVESLAAKFHDIYQQEAKRQGDVRHKDAYADLSENIKEFDRVLARYALNQIHAERAALLDTVRAHCDAILESRDPEDAKGIAAANLCAMGVEEIANSPDRLALDKLIDAKVREARLAEAEWWLACLRTGSKGEKSGYIATKAGPSRIAELRAVPVALLVTANYLGIQYDDEGNPHFVKNPPVPAAPEANQVMSTAGAAFIHANPELPTPEAVCPRCDGQGGFHHVEESRGSASAWNERCPDCHGTGKRTPDGKR